MIFVNIIWIEKISFCLIHRIPWLWKCIEYSPFTLQVYWKKHQVERSTLARWMESIQCISTVRESWGWDRKMFSLSRLCSRIWWTSICLPKIKNIDEILQYPNIFQIIPSCAQLLNCKREKWIIRLVSPVSLSIQAISASFVEWISSL